MTEKTIVRNDAGMRFHGIVTDKFKMSRLSFNFILPADKRISPLTKLMLAVMMRGSANYPSVTKINKRLDELYGATVTWRAMSVGERHIFRISCEILGERFRLPEDDKSILKGVCEVILDILFNPLKNENGLLDSANIESEKKLAVDAIKAKINDQKAYAAEQCKKLMLGDDPAGISVEGTEDQISAFTPAELTENIGYFLKNSVLECFYTGSDDYTEIADMIGDAFASLKRKNVALCGEEKAFIRQFDEELRSKEESMDVSQGRLNIGLTCGVVMSDKDYYAMSLFNEIFGGSSVAKLFMNVREKQSLCYYCYSSYHSATGTLMIGCGIKPENREKAFKEIENQLLEMQKGNFDDNDVNTAKRTVVSGLRQIFDSPSALEAYRFRRFLAGVCETAEESIEKVENVTYEDILAAARKVRIDTVYFLTGNGCEEEWDDE